MNNVLRKKGIVDALMMNTKLTREDCEVLLDTVLDEMTQSLRRGEQVAIRHFGTFRRQIRKGGYPALVPPGAAPKLVRDTPYIRFLPSDELRELTGMAVSSNWKKCKKKKQKVDCDDNQSDE